MAASFATGLEILNTNTFMQTIETWYDNDKLMFLTTLKAKDGTDGFRFDKEWQAKQLYYLTPEGVEFNTDDPQYAELAWLNGLAFTWTKSDKYSFYNECVKDGQQLQ